MKHLFLAVFLLSPVHIEPEVVELRYPLEFTLQKMLEYKDLTLREDIEAPRIRLESQTSLIDFQNAIESQWGFRPEVFVNAYVTKTNEIFLIDEKNYYDSLKRCIDDSLAHELVHFIQSKYQGFDFDDGSEAEAIGHQTQFREEYCFKSN